jgi:hypothetical protein
LEVKKEKSDFEKHAAAAAGIQFIDLIRIHQDAANQKGRSPGFAGVAAGV